MPKHERLNIYVSSTSTDLAEHRKATIEAIMDLDYHPVAMENYGAVAAIPVDKCLEDVRACDVYVLLVAWRYGFIPDGYDQSITELEYREAVKHGKPRLVFVLDEDAPWPRSNMDPDGTRIEAFRAELLNVHVTSFFDGTIEVLVKEVTAALAKFEREQRPRPEDSTRVPAPIVSIAHLPPLAQHFVGRDDELARLDTAWEDPGTTVISLVAFGGVGKSALVAQWLKGLKEHNWRGASHVLGHSFYSQGSREDAQVSADSFIDEALRFFGDEHPEAGSPWDKGERLARLTRETKTLLVLDGMEPLQYSPAAGDAGRIKDPALQALVRELAADNPGLCVITTRQAVADIPAAPKVDLEHLSPQAGAALLKALGVQGREDELEDASREVWGHGLALTLLGNYLRKACGGDVRRIGEVELSQADRRQGSHAHKLMEKYERWLGEGPELSILRLLGLFDRPAETDSLAALRVVPAIPGLTDSLVDLSEQDWNYAVSNLAECGLVATSDYDASLDSHPLVREHFAAQLAAGRPDETREADRRLYEHLKQAALELPDNLQDMMPLYHAVAHGCRAGLYSEVLDDVYIARILRGEECFSMCKLGAFGADLACLSRFFDNTWDGVKPGVRKVATILACTGFDLRAIGRLRAASQPMQAALSILIVEGQVRNAARQANNLSELYLTLGDVSASVHAAEQSVELADRSGDAGMRTIMWTTLADALHQSARPERSLAAFREAEAMQAEWQPEYPLLYSLWGFRYCDLLLEEVSRVIGHLSTVEPAVSGPQIEVALSRCCEVRGHADTTLEWAQHAGQGPLLDRALNHLTLGRTWLLEGQVSSVEELQPEDEALTRAGTHLTEAVSLLRQAGMQDFLPRGLLARAALSICRVGKPQQIGANKSVGVTDNLTQAKKDLNEIEQIAERSGMLIFQIEAALARCRLALALGNRDEARRKLDEAKSLVKQTEKPYEPHQPDWDEWEPPEYAGVFREGEIVGYHRRNAEITALENELERRDA